MDLSRLRMEEIAAAIGGIVLALARFVPAYAPNRDNPNASIDGGRGDASIREAHGMVRVVLLAAAVAPIVLVHNIARGHQPSWPRGEMTAVIGLSAATLLLYVGVLDRPGEPWGQTGLGVGWLVAFLWSIVVAAGGAIRSSEFERERKPPGVL